MNENQCPEVPDQRLCCHFACIVVGCEDQGHVGAGLRRQLGEGDGPAGVPAKPSHPASY